MWCLSATASPASYHQTTRDRYHTATIRNYSHTRLRTGSKAAGVPIRHRKTGPDSVPAPGVATAEQELIRLRAQVKDLQAEKTRLATERDILRSAAKYFAGETNW